MSWASKAMLSISLLGSLAATWVGRFDHPGQPPAPWKLVKVKGKPPTQYSVAVVGGKLAIEAKVESSMALLLRPITIDLSKTPIICWQWYVDGPVTRADMTKKAGDDYAARVYVGFDMPDSDMTASTRFKLDMARRFYSRTMPDAAVVYVWDNKHQVGIARRSSYTDRVQLVVAETGGGRAGGWVQERADLSADFAKAFQSKSGKPVQLALAADGDNTRSKGRAAFSNIHFVGRGEPCAHEPQVSSNFYDSAGLSGWRKP